MLTDFKVPTSNIRTMCIYEQVMNKAFALKSTYDICVYMWICSCVEHDDFTIDLSTYLTALEAEDIVEFSNNLQKKTSIKLTFLQKLKASLIRFLGWLTCMNKR